MREVILDTECTGLEPDNGHRIVEIGCVELVDKKVTGKVWHGYFNPERSMPKDAERIHGLTSDFLSGYPAFAARVDELMVFLGDAAIVAHNAAFDRMFLNAELKRLDLPTLPSERMIDTLELANQRFPGSRNSLDALCKRYRISKKKRTKHGALIDAELLARVYVELVAGERQSALALGVAVTALDLPQPARQRPHPLPPRLTAAEYQEHLVFIATIKNAVWDDYRSAEIQEAA